MKIEQFQVDAFAERVFEGNPAAVCPLNEWLDDKTLTAIAAENNYSETAFYLLDTDPVQLRWFTPSREIDLCGHATLATAFILFYHKAWPKEKIQFETRSGILEVGRQNETLNMNFPALNPELCEMPQGFTTALGCNPKAVYFSDDYIAVLENESQVQLLKPDLKMLESLPGKGVIATAPGDHTDFVSRYFAPKYGVDEDPVTGSAHCKLTPLWAEKLDKTVLSARQLSSRGGQLVCRLQDQRVVLEGNAVLYLKGEIHI